MNQCTHGVCLLCPLLMLNKLTCKHETSAWRTLIEVADKGDKQKFKNRSEIENVSVLMRQEMCPYSCSTLPCPVDEDTHLL